MAIRNFQFLALLCVSLMSGCFRLPAAIEIREEKGEAQWFPGEIWVRSKFKVDLEVIHSAGKGQHLLLLAMPGREREALLEGTSLEQMRNGTATPKALVLRSRVLNAGERDKIRFVAPDQLGLYPILCGIPGHESERAVLRVSER